MRLPGVLARKFFQAAANAKALFRNIVNPCVAVGVVCRQPALQPELRYNLSLASLH